MSRHATGAANWRHVRRWTGYLAKPRWSNTGFELPRRARTTVRSSFRKFMEDGGPNPLQSAATPSEFRDSEFRGRQCRIPAVFPPQRNSASRIPKPALIAGANEDAAGCAIRSPLPPPIGYTGEKIPDARSPSGGRRSAGGLRRASAGKSFDRGGKSSVPTGLLDPKISIRPLKSQIDDHHRVVPSGRVEVG